MRIQLNKINVLYSERGCFLFHFFKEGMKSKKRKIFNSSCVLCLKGTDLNSHPMANRLGKYKPRFFSLGEATSLGEGKL